MSRDLDEQDWQLLMSRIKDGKCTPFLGAGASAPAIPKGADLAQELAQKHEYPFPDCTDLARVTQYLSIGSGDAMIAKEELIQRILKCQRPNFNEAGDPHGMLAELPLPVYMTTNYDDFMYQALDALPTKKPVREVCRWNSFLRRNETSIFESNPAFDPSPAQPLIYHLHGSVKVPESLVLTEDDYLDFLVNLSRDSKMLPPRVERALAGTSLLFIGYSLTDLNFRVIFRGLISATEHALRRISISVQLPPDEAQVAQRQYLDNYFGTQRIRVFWGTAHSFAVKLRERWRDYLHDE